MLPSIAERQVPGYQGAFLLRRDIHGRTRRMTETILLLATRGLNRDLRHQVPGEIHDALLFTAARNVAPS